MISTTHAEFLAENVRLWQKLQTQTTCIFALPTSEPVSFHRQTLGSRIELSQPPVQQYGTVCRLHSDNPAYVLLCLNNILNPTCLIRF